MSIGSQKFNTLFQLAALMRAKKKPHWCSAIRWRIELLRRAATGKKQGRRTDLDEQIRDA